MADTKAVVPVPHNVLKKRKALEELRASRSKRNEAIRQKRKEKRRIIFKRAEAYVNEYRKSERALINARRLAKDGNNFFLEPEPKLLFVIRIRGIMGVDPRTRKILRLLRLRQINNGVFVRANKAIMKMIRLVEPYVTYGYPTLKSVRELIYKRGFGKFNGQRVAITNNDVIQKALGKRDVICIEDVIHQIYTVGPNFKNVNKFLWPFKLNSPKGGFNDKTIHFQEGGDAGNRETHINKLIQRMN